MSKHGEILSSAEMPQSVKLARAILAEKSVFFSEIAASMPWRRMDRMIMATDGRSLFVNPKRIKNVNPKEIAGIIVHELLHRINEHHLRLSLFPSMNHADFNIGADIAINPLVIEAGFSLPEGALQPRRHEDWGASAEAITARIIAEKKKNEEKKDKEEQNGRQKDNTNGSGNEEQDTGNGTDGKKKGEANDEGDRHNDRNGDKDDEGEGGSGEETKSDSEDGNDVADSEESRAEDGDDNRSKDAGGGNGTQSDSTDDDREDEAGGPENDFGTVMVPTNDDGKPLSTSEIAEERRTIREQVTRAATLAEECGQTSHRTAVSAMERIRLNGRAGWINDVETLLGEAQSDDMSWERLSRRHYAMNQIAPGFEGRGLGNVCWAIDTSASVTAEQIAHSALPLIEMLSRNGVEDLRLVLCDEVVTKDVRIPVAELRSHLDIVGRRGTLFHPVFALLSKDAEPTDTLFYSTDLLTSRKDWEMIDEYPERTFWLTDSEVLSAPFGETIRV